jgi:hypothetical protein
VGGPGPGARSLQPGTEGCGLRRTTCARTHAWALRGGSRAVGRGSLGGWDVSLGMPEKNLLASSGEVVMNANGAC